MNRSGTPTPPAGTGPAPHTPPTIGVVLVAAGRGERLGADSPKAFVELGGETLLERAIRTVTALEHPGQLVVVVPRDRAAEALTLTHAALNGESLWRVSVVSGGRERHESVRFGLGALRESVETVLVHDAARPLASSDLFERVLQAVHRTGDGIVPALPVADTLKQVAEDGVVQETVDRSSLIGVQTPQGFPRELLDAAHESLAAREDAAAVPTDDAEVVQRAGGAVRTVPGEMIAHKLTTPQDLWLLEALLAAEGGDAPLFGGSEEMRRSGRHGTRPERRRSR